MVGSEGVCITFTSMSLDFVTCAAAMKAVSHKEIETKTKKILAIVSKA